MNYLLSLALGFISNPLVKSIIKNVVTLLVANASTMIPIAVEEIKKAAMDSTLSADQKFQQVFNALKTQFTDVPASTIGVIIETSYNYLKTNKEFIAMTDPVSKS